ncbi:hypothetical protein PLICRDRAFT_439743 [Plicaturopsis crispa FD-325 SS-3]|uniref:BTB domain-containing protein n=1 Tax=Plicaturopsis crispa FD-325 SS-3 TaxID=944288 RepID=A0A0C9SWJ2_PLICR|nr:hypothetical protein PLICRDRAFT_439743 [Plicaturopsis crispa FD-325 SS-3]
MPYDMIAAEYDYSSDSDLDEDETADVDMGVLKEDSGSEDANYAEARNSAPIAIPSTKNEAALPMLTTPLATPSKVIPVKDVAYKTWKAMIYYLYTSNINFTPLSSRKTGKIGAENANVPSLAASPKSIYRLAKKLELTALCDLAKTEIESQLSEDIIVEEVFSTFTSQFPEIRKLELAFLFMHWDTLKSSAALQGMMRRAVRGEILHAEDVVLDIMAH